MSLFKAREWWSTVAGFEEFHSTGSMTLTTVNKTNIILVGSFNGILRGYAPVGGPFSPDHLLLEKQLEQPIIKLDIAKIRRESPPVLVILFTKQLVYYSLSLDDSQLGLAPINRFPLSHTPYDMIIGGFGRSSEDRICVESIDGQLRIYDYSGEVLMYNLPDALLPGPFCYVPRTDTFMVASVGRSLEAYRYQTLCGGNKGKKGKPDWSLQIGEPVVSMTTIPMSDGPSYVMILGERNLLCLRDMGTLVFAKKLESYATCVLPFKYDQDGCILYMLASRSQQLQIFNNQVMIWSTQLSHQPVALAVNEFGGMKGLIITLDEMGHLQCSYLGTDPTSLAHSFTSIGTVSSVMELECELKLLQNTIEDIDKEGSSTEMHTSQVKVGKVTFGEPRPFESENEESDIIRKCVEVTIEIECTDLLMSDLNLLIDVTHPLSVHPSKVPCNVTSNQTIELMFVCSNEFWPSQRHANLLITYINNQGHPHRFDHTLTLPLRLFCTPVPPQEGQYKLILDSSHNCVPMSVLYQSSEGAGNAVGFQLLTGDIVTIISSKTSNRYRLQSDLFSAIGMFAEDLSSKLQEQHSDGKEFSLSVSSLPLNELFECIENHHTIRLSLDQCEEVLERHCQQFRAIQKRLLARFKDKTPSGLAHLDTLLDGTYMQLTSLIDKCDDLKFQQEKTLSLLTSACQLIILLITLSVNPSLSNEDISILKSTLLPVPTAEHGWEELVDLSVTHLLRTSLAKSAKEETFTLPDLTMPSDCIKLKRHLALFFDRIMKGGRLSTATRSLEDGSTPLSCISEGVPLVHHLPSLREEEEEGER